jgi:tryptophan synthase beta subunit
VVRGPTTNAQVTFIGGQLTVTMVVSCYAGAPTATVTAVGTGSNAVGTFGGDGD